MFFSVREETCMAQAYWLLHSWYKKEDLRGHRQSSGHEGSG